MSPAVLGELRLLASARFDSQPLLCVVLAGDARLIETLRREDLIPLGSRIRTRLATESVSYTHLDVYKRQGVVSVLPGEERVIREWVGEKLITKDGIRNQVLRGAGTSEGLRLSLIHI